MKNKILTLALICICTILAGAVCACTQDTADESQTNAIEYTLSTEGTNYVVSGADNVKGDVVIEATYNGLPVTEISYSAFNGCDKMTSVTIPNGVTKIRGNAFSGCTSLASVEIPDSVTEIHYNAFMRCSSLVEIVIPDSVTYLSYNVFRNCTALERVTLSANLEYIGGSLFYLCDNLQYNIYNNAKYVGSSQNDYMLLYSAASNDITSCEIHESTQFINSYAFSKCTSLTQITMDGEMTQTGYYAFNGCTALEKVILGENITEISVGCFNGCTSITSVEISDSVTIIENNAFNNCSALVNLTLPKSLTSIESEAFCACSSLENLKIPDSVTNIGSDAFNGCVKLWDIEGDVHLIDGWVMFGVGTKTEITIPDGARGIADEAFTNYIYMGNSIYSSSVLTYIYIPASVKHIGKSAFAGCPLETAVFEDPEGWYADWYLDDDGNPVQIPAENLSDPATAASYLTSSYDESWHKEG